MMNSLFNRKTVYVSEQKTQLHVFNEISADLFDKDLVKNTFFENLMEREYQFPTGLDLSSIDRRLPNIAIPHTESQFVNTSRIIPIKLTSTVPFHNMISPHEQFSVTFLFMILNAKEEEQTHFLANLMDFLHFMDKEVLLAFFELDNADEIYRFLVNHFNKEVLK